MKNDKNILWAIPVGVVLMAILYFASSRKIEEVLVPEPQPAAVCTMDAMQCPDGSWVGRTGPNCQFACSATTSSVQSGMMLEAKLNQSVTGYSEIITPIGIIEDSRCPHDVQCIQAGTVRISIKIQTTVGVTTSILKLGESIQTPTEIITLYSVGPEKISTKTIKQSDYVFVIKVTRK